MSDDLEKAVETMEKAVADGKALPISDAERAAWRAAVGAQLDRHQAVSDKAEGMVRTVVAIHPPPPCWQCDAPLGTTEECMTCAAKRREGQG